MMDGGIRDWLRSLWNGIETFLAQEAGFCMISNGCIVSMCLPTVIGGGEAETQIWTDDEFRGRGLAKLTATAFIVGDPNAARFQKRVAFKVVWAM
jgi:hypothetical protein